MTHIPRAPILPTSTEPPAIMKHRTWIGAILSWPARRLRSLGKRLGISISLNQYVGMLGNRRYVHITMSWPYKKEK